MVKYYQSKSCSNDEGVALDVVEKGAGRGWLWKIIFFALYLIYYSYVEEDVAIPKYLERKALFDALCTLHF
eukprot:scaffold204_cov135-Skeletonema_menzelii.AAC.9